MPKKEEKPPKEKKPKKERVKKIKEEKPRLKMETGTFVLSFD